MARILSHNDINDSARWYDQIEPSTMYEAELESQILVHSEAVYPNYFVVPFKKTLRTFHPGTGENDTVKADLAFIAKDYKEWWVVEVETGTQGLKSHAIPQVKKLSNADYKEEVVEYLVSQNGELVAGKVRRLVLETETKILVLMNRHLATWTAELNRIGVSVGIFEVFRGSGGGEILRVNGEYPSTYNDMVSNCYFHPGAKRLLGVEKPQNLDLPPNREVFRLTFNNCLTEWKRLNANGRVWLEPLHRNPLKNTNKYQIFRRNDGALVLLENPEPKQNME